VTCRFPVNLCRRLNRGRIRGTQFIDYGLFRVIATRMILEGRLCNFGYCFNG
jgi:hypothetical protein